jgi:phosphoribosylamine--glycine ligase
VGLRVVIVGAGGRDHALAHAFHRSPLLDELHVVPGNGGIGALATTYTDLALVDVDGIVRTIIDIAPDFAVVGPEDLLVAGVASRLQDAGIVCLGPTEQAAQLEGSKLFSKQLMEAAGVPTPPWRACTTPDEARAAVQEFGGSVAVKADGLAMGCGAYVCHTSAAADEAIDELMVQRRFGASADRVIVEQLVDGAEASVMALVDGTNVVPLPVARDYKRLLDDDRGPNTGGMGAHAPSQDITAEAAAELAQRCIAPVVAAMRERGTEFRGVVYAGVMLSSDGPTVLEYNCRFGNPETQALVRVIDADLLELLHRAASGSLDGQGPIGATGAAVAVNIAAEHYPDQQLEPELVGVRGLAAASEVQGVELFLNLGRELDLEAGTYRAAGGRMVTVSAWAEDLPSARSRAYEAAALIEVDGAQMRTDVGGHAAVGASVS